MLPQIKCKVSWRFLYKMPVRFVNMTGDMEMEWCEQTRKSAPQWNPLRGAFQRDVGPDPCHRGGWSPGQVMLTSCSII